MIERIIVTSLFVIGYCCTFWEGMIFAHLGDYLESILPEWLCKPLFSCFICACMWIGSLFYWIVFHDNALYWLVTVIGAMGFNAVISRIFEINDNDTKHN